VQHSWRCSLLNKLDNMLNRHPRCLKALKDAAHARSSLPFNAPSGSAATIPFAAWLLPSSSPSATASSYPIPTCYAAGSRNVPCYGHSRMGDVDHYHCNFPTYKTTQKCLKQRTAQGMGGLPRRRRGQADWATRRQRGASICCNLATHWTFCIHLLHAQPFPYTRCTTFIFTRTPYLHAAANITSYLDITLEL